MIYASDAQIRLIHRKLFWCDGYLDPDEIALIKSHRWSNIEAHALIDDLFKITAPCETDGEKADRETAIKSIRLTLSKV